MVYYHWFFSLMLSIIIVHPDHHGFFYGAYLSPFLNPQLFLLYHFSIQFSSFLFVLNLNLLVVC